MRKASLLVACLVGSMTLVAAAQDTKPQDPAKPTSDAPATQPRQPGGGGGRMQQLSPEKQKAAWESQTKTAVAGFALNEEKTKAVTKAYIDARTSYAAALTKAREEAGGEQPDFAEMQKRLEKISEAERTKFRDAIGSNLSAEQTTEVMGSLGAFNMQWDRMADTLLSFGLDAKKLDEANKATKDYIVSVSKLRTTEDPEARRTAMQDARKKLTETLKPVLSEEQMAKFEPTMGGRGRGGPGGPGGGGNDGDPAPRRRPNGGG